MSAKYIVFEADGYDLMITFPEVLVHRQVAAKTFDTVLQFGNPASLVSAGFIHCGKCCGESESLGLKSRPYDQEVLDRGLFTTSECKSAKPEGSPPNRLEVQR